MTSLTALAKAKLKDLEKDIRDASTVLSQKESAITELTSDEEARRSRIVNLAEEEKGLISSIESKRAEEHGLDVAYSEKQQKMHNADIERETARREKENHERRQNELISENASMEADKTERKREMGGLQKVKEALEVDVKRLTGEKVTLRNDLSVGRALLARVQATYDRVKGAIERAIEQFQVFENRIGRLSEETGYMISWDDPKALLEEE